MCVNYWLFVLLGKKDKLRVYYLSWLRNKILHNDPEVEKKQGWTTVGDLEGCVHYKVGKSATAARALLFRGSVYLLFKVYVFLKLLVRNLSLIFLAHLKHLLILRSTGLSLNHNQVHFSRPRPPSPWPWTVHILLCKMGFRGTLLRKHCLKSARPLGFFLGPASWFSLEALWVLGSHWWNVWEFA